MKNDLTATEATLNEQPESINDSNSSALAEKATPNETSLQSAQLPEVLTVVEVAALLRCDRKTIYEAIRRRNLPHQKISARALRFSRDAVLQWLRSGQWRTYHKR